MNFTRSILGFISIVAMVVCIILSFILLMSGNLYGLGTVAGAIWFLWNAVAHLD